MKVIFHAILNLEKRYYADECLNRKPPQNQSTQQKNTSFDH